MSDPTHFPSQMECGDSKAAAQLLPLVYDELRRMATLKLARERPGQTLQATALVHEAYLRLLQGGASGQRWDSRRHFLAAAAEAMRRILVENARSKNCQKRGGRLARVDLAEIPMGSSESADDLLSLDEALTELQQLDPQAAELVKLRCFAGLPMIEAAESLGISLRTANRTWAFARAWLYRRLHGLPTLCVP